MFVKFIAAEIETDTFNSHNNKVSPRKYYICYMFDGDKYCFNYYRNIKN